MKRILVTGLKEPLGGVESAVMGYIRYFDHTMLRVDVAVFGEDFSLRDEIEALGGRVWLLPSRVKQRKAYKKVLAGIFEKNAYDAVWCNFSGLTNIDFLKAAKAVGVPIRIAHAHTAAFAWGTPLMRYIVPLLHQKHQRVLHRYATHLWTCSASAAAFMYGEKPFCDVRLVPNAIDTAYFRYDANVRKEIREQFGCDNRPVIVHVGRMCTAKNQKFLLEIFGAVLHKQPDAHLLFVGDGELRGEVKAYAATVGVAHAVTFTGERQDISCLLQAADIFLLPSLTEGFPVTVVEAQAAGLPCVVSAEAVPDTVNITGNVRFVSLQACHEQWARTVLEQLGGRTENADKLVRAAGYDSSEAAKRLQEFFCEGKAL